MQSLELQIFQLINEIVYYVSKFILFNICLKKNCYEDLIYVLYGIYV